MASGLRGRAIVTSTQMRSAPSAASVSSAGCAGGSNAPGAAPPSPSGADQATNMVSPAWCLGASLSHTCPLSALSASASVISAGRQVSGPRTALQRAWAPLHGQHWRGVAQLLSSYILRRRLSCACTDRGGLAAGCCRCLTRLSQAAQDPGGLRGEALRGRADR